MTEPTYVDARCPHCGHGVITHRYATVMQERVTRWVVEDGEPTPNEIDYSEEAPHLAAQIVPDTPPYVCHGCEAEFNDPIIVEDHNG